MKLGQLEKKLFLTFFPIGIFFLVFFHKFIIIICPNWIQKSLIFQEKIAKFELSQEKKVLDECSSTLKIFLVKYVHISILIRCYI